MDVRRRRDDSEEIRLWLDRLVFGGEASRRFYREKSAKSLMVHLGDPLAD